MELGEGRVDNNPVKIAKYFLIQLILIMSDMNVFCECLSDYHERL